MTGSSSARLSSDIVITADIPLAGRCVKKGATVIGPTGKPFTDNSIGMALATRDLLTGLRSAGATTRGPPPLTRQDISRFLSALDLAVTRLKRKADLTADARVGLLRRFGHPAMRLRPAGRIVDEFLHLGQHLGLELAARLGDVEHVAPGGERSAT